MLTTGAIRETRAQLQGMLQACQNQPDYEDFHSKLGDALSELDTIADATGKPKERETVTVGDRAKRSNGSGDPKAQAKQELLDRLHAA